MVCQSFYRMHKCESLWKRLAKARFPENLQRVEIPPTGSWRIYYASKMVWIKFILLEEKLIFTYFLECF